jgi:hypothetical protein
MFMKNMILPAFLLLSPLFSGAAQLLPPGPPPDSTAQSSDSGNQTSGNRPAAASALAGLNKAMSETAARHAKTEACFELEGSLKAAVDKKRAEINAEFRGKTPDEFIELLSRKQQRFERQHKTCAVLYEQLGKDYEALMLWFRNYEPKSLNVKKQKAMVDEQKEKFLLMQPTAKPYNKDRKKARAQN